MDLSLAARGLVLGFTIAAAVGPISVLTIRRTLAHGWLYGIASGLGVALADSTYAAIAAFGLTALTNLLVGARMWLGLVGGSFLIWLGLRTMMSPPTGPAAGADARPGLLAAFGSIFGLTLTNPMTILSFAGLFAGLAFSGGAGVTGASGGTAASGAAGANGGAASAIALTVGVFLGSTLWWLVLTTTVATLRSRVTLRGLSWVNRVSGGVVTLFGVAAIVAASR